MGNAKRQQDGQPYVVINFRIEPEQRDALRRIGQANQRTLSQEARFAIARRIAEADEEERAA